MKITQKPKSCVPKISTSLAYRDVIPNKIRESKSENAQEKYDKSMASQWK